MKETSRVLRMKQVLTARDFHAGHIDKPGQSFPPIEQIARCEIAISNLFNRGNEESFWEVVQESYALPFVSPPFARDLIGSAFFFQVTDLLNTMPQATALLDLLSNLIGAQSIYEQVLTSLAFLPTVVINLRNPMKLSGEVRNIGPSTDCKVAQLFQ